MIDSVTPWQVLASFSLVLVTVAVSAWLKLGLTRSILVAAARAAVQLVAVGVLFTLIIQSDQAMVLAWVWVVVMVGITATVARRRSPAIPGIATATGVVVAFTVGLALAIVFGLGIVAYEPVNLIVVAGITIGNALPSLVLGAKQLTAQVAGNRGEIEALLSLGMDRRLVTEEIGGRIARTALVPQIERTNVVGLIALPGAMTGLLLAGVDPIDAVLVQLAVMYLVLGTVATAVVATMVLEFRALLPDDLILVKVDPAPSG